MDSSILKKVFLFANLDKAELDAVFAICKSETYAMNDVIFREGARGDSLYLVVEGAVRISKTIPGVGEEALVVLRNGEFFGEMSLVDEQARSADALAHEACNLLAIDKKDFENLLLANKDLAHSVLWTFVKTLSTRLRETNEKVRSFLAMAGNW